VRNLRLCLVLVLVAVSLTACKRKEYEVNGGDGVMAEVLPSMMTEVEERSFVLLTDMADILESMSDRPDDAVRRVEAFLRVNADDMRENAAQLQARYDAMEPYEARIYEAQIAEYMGRAMSYWLVRERPFSAANPDQGRIIRDMIEAVDTPDD
jgi:hypothetical protein